MSTRGRLGAVLLALTGSATGCATASPTPEARRVIPVNGVPGPRCENLGTVIGQTQARRSEATQEQLVSEATTDALERAAALGATHIFLSPVTLRHQGGAPASATLTGVAFRCPPAAP